MSFVEQSSIEAGFAHVFDSEIAPKLDALERRRRTALRKSRVRLATAAGIGVALGGGLAALAGSFVPLFVLGILGVVVGVILAGIAQSPFRGAVADLVMRRVCRFLGDMTYTANGRDAVPVGAMRDLGLVGKHSSARLRHLLTGRWRDTDFRMVHARLTRRSGTSSSTSSSRTVFAGLLFCVSVPVSAPTRIVIGRDYGVAGNALAGLLGSRGGRGMPRVASDNARFEGFFEVHAEDPQAARDFMPDPLLDALVDIGEQEGGRAGARRMTAGFEGDRFYIALERKGDFLGIGKLHDPLDELEEKLHGLFEDVTTARRVIDRLHGDAPAA